MLGLAVVRMRPSSFLPNFIVFEGIDGSGTTTQLKLLSNRLSQQGVPYLATFEPTDGAIGQLIRQVLQHKLRLQPISLAYLFAADRNEHLYHPTKGILVELAKGKLVICDRYLFSSLAYQALTTDLDLLKKLNSDFPLPQLVFYLDTPAAVCFERLKDRQRLELFEDLTLQEQVAQNYHQLWANWQGRLEVIQLDGSKPPEEISQQIWKRIAELPILKK